MDLLDGFFRSFDREFPPTATNWAGAGFGNRYWRKQPDGTFARVLDREAHTALPPFPPSK